MTDRPDAPAGPSRPVPLPPQELRTGGAHFVDDGEYLRTAVRDVEALRVEAGLGASSRILDWGCGAGRLAIGLLTSGTPFSTYSGIDVQADFIDWSSRNLGTDRMVFTRVDAPNGRYNPAGLAAHDIPAEPGSVDVFYAYSVFSHLVADDASRYLRVISRILAPDGRAVVTAFVEPGVQAWQENPQGYGPLVWDGPLHCVRYDVAFFTDIARAGGLDVLTIAHGGETDGQSQLVLARAARS